MKRTVRVELTDRQRWLRLRRSMSTEAYLAENDYGVSLLPKRIDLKLQNRAIARVLRKLLKETP